MFIYSVVNGVPFITDLALAQATNTDSITVSGGTGVYDINYVFSVAGSLSSNSPSLTAEFCANLSLPQGTANLQTQCEQNGKSGQSLNTFTLSYAELFGSGPITTTLTLQAFDYANGIYATAAPMGTPLISGTATANFGDTITLTDILITNADGAPIPGITLASADGYSYPLDSANAVPEPSMLIVLVFGSACVVLYRGFRPGGRAVQLVALTGVLFGLSTPTYASSLGPAYGIFPSAEINTDLPTTTFGGGGSYVDAPGGVGPITLTSFSLTPLSHSVSLFDWYKKARSGQLRRTSLREYRSANQKRGDPHPSGHLLVSLQKSYR